MISRNVFGCPKHCKVSVLILACLLVLPIIGCNDSDFLETYPAQGRITFNGRPMAGARLTLYPTSQDETMQNVMPKATVNADGSFSLHTYKVGDGVPEGEYKLTVVWPNGSDEMSETPGYISDLLYGRFASMDQSQIQVKIEAGVNEIPDITLK